MTKDQTQAILERVLTWPENRQEDAARILLQMEQDTESYTLDEEDLADVDEALEEIRRGDPPASEEEVRAVLDRYRT